MQKKTHPFGSSSEAILYSLFVIIAMWLVFWADHLLKINSYEYGVLPRSVEGLKGIVFMPLIHSQNDFRHIVNNSLPTFFLLAALVYFYREIAFKVFFYGWILTGFLVWAYAENKGSYHIGISGLIYLLAAFLFVSGVLRKFLPLQAISMFVVFIYGSMIWGIFPMEEKVSWEGHLMGFGVGIIFAFIFQGHGPQRPKFQYEIEKEMGIEPPDLEGIYLEKVRLAELEEEEKRQIEKVFVYHYVEDKPSQPSNEETATPANIPEDEIPPVIVPFLEKLPPNS
jgi:membrane associated rhomboid family serine protease